MNADKRKGFADLPKFVVTKIRPGSSFIDGYQDFELEGSYDAALERQFENMTAGNGPQWFWLLFGERGSLCPMLKSFDRQRRTAVLTCFENSEPKVLGMELACLSSYWQAFNVWMVLDPNWGWERTQLRGADAIAEDYEAKDVSIVGGREIKVWTKLEPVDAMSGESRHYPAADQTAPVNLGSRLIRGGWGHEHCQLCNERIEGREFGYRDPEDRWMCVDCHLRYVIPHDLAFVDEL